jgi:hypothetical protein
MAAEVKEHFLQDIKNKYGQIVKTGNSLSLFNLIGTDLLIYTRYSKVHQNSKTFYGLRDCDLKLLEGHPSVICFLWDNQNEPMLLPYIEFEEIFHSISPAEDGQYKVQIYFNNEGTELYIPTIGRFGVDFYYGWHVIDNIINSSNSLTLPELSHSQIQTLIGSIGFQENYDIWIPQSDRNSLDWGITSKFKIKNNISSDLSSVSGIIEEVDVVWFGKDNRMYSLFEVEHSTPIYSGLLRFNDIHLEFPNLSLIFNIVANIERKSLFTKQINRPTFNQSGLKDLCTFYDYLNIYSWYSRLSKGVI